MCLLEAVSQCVSWRTLPHTSALPVPRGVATTPRGAASREEDKSGPSRFHFFSSPPSSPIFKQLTHLPAQHTSLCVFSAHSHSPWHRPALPSQLPLHPALHFQALQLPSSRTCSSWMLALTRYTHLPMLPSSTRGHLPTTFMASGRAAPPPAASREYLALHRALLLL